MTWSVLIGEQHRFPYLPISCHSQALISVPYIFLIHWSSEYITTSAGFWALYKKRFPGKRMLMDLVGAPSSTCSLWSVKWIIFKTEWCSLAKAERGFTDLYTVCMIISLSVRITWQCPFSLFKKLRECYTILVYPCLCLPPRLLLAIALEISVLPH